MRRAAIHTLGRRGETLAAWIYRLQGFRIIGRNLVEGGVEIDLIATRGSRIAFVEVKTRSSQRHGEPWEAVDQKRRERMFRAAERYLSRTRESRTARYDVVSIIWSRFIPNVRIYRDAFMFISDPERPWKRKIVANRGG